MTEAIAVRDEAARLVARKDRAKAEIVGCRDDVQRLELRGEFKAIQAAAVELGRNDIAVEYAALVHEVERAIVKANPPIPPEERRNNTVAPCNGIIPGSTMRTYRRTHEPSTDEEFADLVEESKREQVPLTREMVRLKTLRRPRSGHGLDNDDEWYTPPYLVAACRATMGGIDLDPASCEIAQKVVQAKRYYTADSDGLLHDWFGRVFMNPPYSAELKRGFLEKLAKEYRYGGVLQACVILSYDFSASWYEPIRPMVREICTLRGRVKFYKEHPEDRCHPSAGTSIHFIGQAVEAFGPAFQDLGEIWSRWRKLI